MADFLSWRDDWNNGIDWVDRDHREMVNRLNRLAQVGRHETGDSQTGSARLDLRSVLAALDALIDHNRRHFQAEEAFLRQIGFPGYEEHRREHLMQMAEFLDLRRQLERGLEQGQTGTLDPEILEDFKRWFFNHVIAEDRVYAEFYRTRREGDPDQSSAQPGNLD